MAQKITSTTELRAQAKRIISEFTTVVVRGRNIEFPFKSNDNPLKPSQ